MVNSPEPEIQGQKTEIKAPAYQKIKPSDGKRAEQRKEFLGTRRVKVIGLNAWLDRIQAGKRQAASQGRHQGGVTPYGYRKVFDPDLKRFELKPEVFESS